MVDQRDDNRNHDNGHSSGNQGFASMPKDKVQDIASKGGQTSHKGEGQSGHTDHTTDAGQDHGNDKNHASDHGTHTSGAQGFASMSEDKVKEIASQGGKSS